MIQKLNIWIFRLSGAFLLFLFVYGSCLGQFSGLDLLAGKKKKTVSFDYIAGYVVVNLTYANLLTLKFIVDTGASHNILFKKEINDIMFIPYTDTISLKGSDLSLSIDALVARNVPMQLEGTKELFRDIIVLEEDILMIEEILGHRVEGLLGGDFFKGLVVEFNFEKKKLTLSDPAYYVKPPKALVFDAAFHNYKPYLEVPVKINDRIDTLDLLLDTGAALSLMIHTNKIDDFKMPENTILGTLGRGLGGDLMGFVGMSDYIIIDTLRLDNVITSFQDIDSISVRNDDLKRDGMLGTGVLSRFNMAVDYLNNKIYLTPRKNINKPFEYDKSGLQIHAYGPRHDEFFINNVYPGTPAADAGLKPGDKILKIGFWPLGFYTLDGIIKKFKKKEGTVIKMKVQRGDQVLKFRFRLRNLFGEK